jgi:putative transcriptional regulator
MKRNATANAKGRKTTTAHVVESDDIPPMTAADLAKLRPVALSKRIRGELKLSQEQFAERYGLSLATLRDWEQYRTEPDTAALSYLKVIQADPRGTAKALKKAAAA